ncbi:murein DD-endopeptidase MepM/ murein hydrolase activator NlpD [Rhodovulum imhoffii]|uniref:Murein DD-endopeptidase MepM/ murein hydrolase activator NlpD n=1 Tax=Rhodovulum imhoffii TaxID=365340 RepID=A0A2T5BVR4_9RHOB|nr:DUF5930 domain-containing protein [Rhodovulum imhoffii]MBK5933226.1 peptidase M23 [Rhodovulum imhoffii]PTN03673.1 murein DD-endopeptidase MepM/ murein hydrolase activator NlpD [Rhodovulum imhoffii]
MAARLKHRIDTALGRLLPEQRLFLRTDNATRFLRISPLAQLFTGAAAIAIAGTAMVSTTVLLMDSVSTGNLRDKTQREQISYETRLNAMAQERDRSIKQAEEAHERFKLALVEVSGMQSALLASEERSAELAKGMDAMQQTLRRIMAERDTARTEARALAARLESSDTVMAGHGGEAQDALRFLSDALEDTAQERTLARADAAAAYKLADALAYRNELARERNERIFTQLEEAMTISVEPLEKMFAKAGLNPDSLLKSVRQGYSGIGGPLTPLSYSTKGTEPHPDEVRGSALLARLDELNLYRIAAESAPFASPLRTSYRMSSPFGYRNHPIIGGSRMHAGVDMAGAHGSPIYATADGVVVRAGWVSGYGRMVDIRHDYGITTRYAHMSKLRVSKGERVSRGQQIGDMGNTGRSTGTHLHYEVRVNDKPVNPMTYIKAAKDVF